MHRLEKILEKIKEDYQHELYLYKRKKYCRYTLVIIKTSILSLSIGLSFISIFGILTAVLIPIIDSIQMVSNLDQSLSDKKLKKQLLGELINNIESKLISIKEDDINEYITYINGQLRCIFTF